MRYEAQEDHGTSSRGQLETTMPGSSSWMLYASQGVKEIDDVMMIILSWNCKVVCNRRNQTYFHLQITRGMKYFFIAHRTNTGT